MTAPEFHNSD